MDVDNEKNCFTGKSARPLLTVDMPVFNAMPYLPIAVESILAQTYSNFVFLIINDGSTDESSDYLDSLNDPRLKIIHQENRGLGYTLNRALDLCSTTYCALMGADDYSHPKRLELQLAELKKNSDTVLVGTNINYLVQDRRIRRAPFPLKHKHIVEKLVNGRPVICHPSIMFVTEAARKTGGYRIQGSGEDFDFFLRMSLVGKISNISDVLLDYRMHLNSIVATKYDSILLGKAYASACYRAQILDTAEPDLEEFEKNWGNKSSLKKVCNKFLMWSGISYRKAIINKANNNYCRYYFYLINAAVFNPIYSVRLILDISIKKILLKRS